MKSSTIRVAVLDDDALAAEMIRDVLADNGLSATAYTSAAVLWSAQQHTGGHDVFVLDWALGAETAEVLIRQLRNTKPSAPIFLLSGHLTDNGRPLDPAIGAVLQQFDLVYLQKPISIRELAQRIIATMMDDGGGADP